MWCLFSITTLISPKLEETQVWKMKTNHKQHMMVSTSECQWVLEIHCRRAKEKFSKASWRCSRPDSEHQQQSMSPQWPQIFPHSLILILTTRPSKHLCIDTLFSQLSAGCVGIFQSYFTLHLGAGSTVNLYCDLGLVSNFESTYLAPFHGLILSHYFTESTQACLWKSLCTHWHK